MTFADVAIALAGAAIVLGMLGDVFQSVVVPRAVGRWRPSSHLTRLLWRIWPPVAMRYRDEDRREDFLATFAPFALIALLLMWVVVLIVGYGLTFYAFRSQIRPQPVDVFQAMYFAGTTLLTIGFGDFVGTTRLAHFISLAAGASGLSVVAVVTAFLFAVFGAFQRREVFVTWLGTRSGAPPSGLGLVTIHAYNGLLADLPALFVDGQKWTIEVMESHLAYPILSYFRSSHDYESWVGALGTLLDAALLLITTVEGQAEGQARIMYWSGRHLVRDFVNYYGLAQGSGPGIERYEFQQARARLEELGFRLHDEEAAWTRFSEMRATYAPGLAAMANFWRIPPLQWIGDRSLVNVDHLRALRARPLETEKS